MIKNNINRDLEKKIDYYINGKLTTHEIDVLWSDLIQNEYYLEYTKTFANLKTLIQREKEVEKIISINKFSNMVAYGAVAAFAIIIGVIGILNFNANSTSSNDMSVINWIEYDTYRSSNIDNPDVIDNELVKAAVMAANDGNIEEAIKILENGLLMETDFQVLAKLSLSLGSIQYNNGNYASALINFQQATLRDDIDNKILEKGFWYLANTQIQLDNLLDAEKSLQKTYIMNGQYSRVAKRYLNEINNIVD